MNKEDAKHVSMFLLLFCTYLRTCDTEHKVDQITLKLDQCIASSQSNSK